MQMAGDNMLRVVPAFAAELAAGAADRPHGSTKASAYMDFLGFAMVRCCGRSSCLLESQSCCTTSAYMDNKSILAPLLCALHCRGMATSRKMRCHAANCVCVAFRYHDGACSRAADQHCVFFSIISCCVYVGMICCLVDCRLPRVNPGDSGCTAVYSFCDDSAR